MRRVDPFPFLLLALVLLAALLGLGCSNDPPVSPTSIYVSNVNTNIQGGGAQPSPSPGTAALPPGSTVRIEIFGSSCPAGGSAQPNPGQLRLGCSLAITATPKGPTNENLPIEVHGNQCSWAVPVGAAALSLVPDGSQPFNATVMGTAVGSAAVTATVKGTIGTLSLTVVP